MACGARLVLAYVAHRLLYDDLGDTHHGYGHQHADDAEELATDDHRQQHHDGVETDHLGHHDWLDRRVVYELDHGEGRNHRQGLGEASGVYQGHDDGRYRAHYGTDEGYEVGYAREDPDDDEVLHVQVPQGEAGERADDGGVDELAADVAAELAVGLVDEGDGELEVAVGHEAYELLDDLAAILEQKKHDEGDDEGACEYGWDVLGVAQHLVAEGLHELLGLLHEVQVSHAEEGEAFLDRVLYVDDHLGGLAGTYGLGEVGDLALDQGQEDAYAPCDEGDDAHEDDGSGQQAAHAAGLKHACHGIKHVGQDGGHYYEFYEPADQGENVEYAPHYQHDEDELEQSCGG